MLLLLSLISCSHLPTVKNFSPGPSPCIDGIAADYLSTGCKELGIGVYEAIIDNIDYTTTYIMTELYCEKAKKNSQAATSSPVFITYDTDFYLQGIDISSDNYQPYCYDKSSVVYLLNEDVGPE